MNAFGRMYSRIFLFFLVIALAFTRGIAGEGMYPLSEIGKLDLHSKGLRVSAQEIFNPGKVSLIDAIVRVGGCTGSFVSAQGLIITNHHCAFGSVQAASSAERDYVTDGFLAKNPSGEIEAKGVTVRITESYRDVSQDVLSVVSETMDFATRSKSISRKTKELVAEAEKQNPGKRVEIAEMFAGRSYVMFIYTFIKDVRLVYVPPRAIGEFGGEEDNWTWPRHTGDFSFMRAYVAPDGSPADYSPANVPYQPRKFLRVNPNGVDENDPVFILGYPGRTYRHRTSHYLSYEEAIRMPYVAELYDWMISTMDVAGEADRAIALKFDARKKSLANTEKNYLGKLKGLKRLQLVEKKRREEQALQTFIDSDAKRKAVYGTLLKEIGAVYEEVSAQATYELTLDYLRQASNMMSLASSVYEAVRELQKPDIERESSYMDRNYARTKESLFRSLQNYHEPTDKVFLKEMLMRALALPNGKRIQAIDSIFSKNRSADDVDKFLDQLYSTTRLNDSTAVVTALAKTPEEIDALHDPFLELAGALSPAHLRLKEDRQKRDGALTKLYALLVDVKEQFMKKNFIPDANGTLRLTYGSVKGYAPADALYASPITSVRGILDKTTGNPPFDTPGKIADLHHARDFGRFKHEKLNDVPVALLYDLDTTGGNSGSPLMNGKGELVGVNFDRAFEATINDYAWSESYSRSIAVDIRYVLWVTEKFAGASFLLEEMGISVSN